MKSTSAWVLASCLLVACGGDDTTGGGAGSASTGTAGTTSAGSGGNSSTGAGGTSSTGAGGSAGGGAGTSATGGNGGTAGTGGSVGAGGAGGAGGSGMMLPADENLCGMVMLTANKIIPAAKVTAVCAGAVITASMGVSISVQGTLRVDGTAAMPVMFKGTTTGVIAWTGIVLEATGTLSMTYGQIDDAAFAIAAKAGSKYDVDHLVLNSEKMLNLMSSGTINHGVFHARGARQRTIGDPILVVSASPHISNTLLDLGGGVDYVNVSGATSAAVFDHMDMSAAHCAFHFDGGNGNTISNSNIHGNSYGLMVEASTNNKITHNNFTANTPHIGDCNGGSAMVTDNYFQGAAFGGSPTCVNKLMSVTPAAAPYPTTGAGAVGPQP